MIEPKWVGKRKLPDVRTVDLAAGDDEDYEDSEPSARSAKTLAAAPEVVVIEDPVVERPP